MGAGVFLLTDSNGNYCYCVQLGTDHEDSAVMSSITFNDNAMVKLYSDRNQRERVRVNLQFMPIKANQNTDTVGMWNW